jgi:acyl-CoA reductase-like NAD-dependent aldehyde dehydrogenase
MTTQTANGAASAPPGDARLDECVDRARCAAAAMRELDQPAVDRIVWEMVVAGLEHAVELARLAMDETGFGVLEDKVVKNLIATEFLYDYLKDKPSVGIIERDEELAIDYVAEPIGVVLALLPITNPTSTALFKSIVGAKTRNAMIFRPSARAVGCATCPTRRSTSPSTCSIIRASTSYGPPAGPRRSRRPTKRASRASASGPAMRRSTSTAAPTSRWRWSTS